MRVNLLVAVAVLCSVAGVSGVVVPTPVSDPGVYGPVVSRGEQLAGSGRGYLAVWTRPGWIGGARLDKEGHRLDYELRMSTLPFTDYAARSSVASDGTDYLVAVIAGSQMEVAFVSSETGMVKRAFQRSGAVGLTPQMIWDGSSYVLCWTRSLTSGTGIEVMRLDHDGTVLSSNDQETALVATGILASNGRDLAMFRSDARGATRGTLLASGRGPITMPVMDFGVRALIAVASDGERYLAVTRNDAVVSAQLFKNDLTPIGVPVRIGLVDFYSQPVVAPRRHGFVVFMERMADVYRVVIDDVPSEPYTVLSSASVQSAVDAGDANALILCHSRLVSQTVSSAMLDLATPRLVADEETTPVALEPIVPKNISIASAGGKFAIAWQTSDAAGDRIFVRRFDETGKPLATPVLVGEGDTPSLASDGAGGYLVGWLRRPSIYSTLPALALLGADGTMKSGILDSLPRKVTSIRVVWARDHYAAVWRRNEGTLNSVAVRISRDGHLIDFEPIAVTAGRRESTDGVVVESDPLVTVTGTGIFLAVPATLYAGAVTTTFVEGVLRSFDLGSMRGPERLTLAPATAATLSANAPLILTFRRSSGEPSRFVRITDDGSLIDDALGRLLENGQPPATTAWIHDRWLVAWPDHIAYVDASGARLSAPPVAAAETAFAPSLAGAWYARACKPPEGDVSQLCLGSLTGEAAHTQRRAAH